MNTRSTQRQLAASTPATSSRGRSSTRRSSSSSKGRPGRNVSFRPEEEKRSEEKKEEGKVEENKHHEEKKSSPSSLGSPPEEELPPARHAHRSNDVSLNANFLKNTRLNKDGTNIEPWIYKLYQAYQTAELMPAISLRLRLEKDAPLKTINIFEDRGYWSKISNLSNHELLESLPSARTEPNMTHKIKLAMLYATQTVHDDLIHLFQDRPAHPAIVIACVGNFFRPTDNLSQQFLFG